MSSTPPKADARPRKPPWLKVKAPGGERYTWIRAQRKSLGLATVCEEARCPNVGECWGQGTATFMVLGAVCTRGCRFCAVTTRKEGQPVDREEAAKLAQTIQAMELDYVVLTMVDRDDLEDGGASHVAECVARVREASPEILVELLAGDFQGKESSLATLAGSGAAVLAHNLETVWRLTPKIRDGRSSYSQSLAALETLKALAPHTPIKSGIMMGMGETEGEVEETLADLRGAGVNVVTLGQYLQPSPRHWEVAEYLHPDRFERYRELAMALGFDACFSGPLVRSSYKAAELFLSRKLREEQVVKAPE